MTVTLKSSLRANDDCWCGSGKKYKRCHRAALLRPGAVGPRRACPPRSRVPTTPRPATRCAPPRPMVKSADVIERMRVAGAIARDVLHETGAAVAPGVTTDELDRVAHEAHIARNVYPSPLGYKGFPKSVCTSVNEVICHGIPDDRALVDGDIVNVDVTVYVDGVHGDTNATFCVGRRRRRVEAPRARHRASASTSRSKRCDPARRSPTSAARSRRTRTPPGFNVVRAFVGSRHRRGVPRTAAGAALLRAGGAPRSWSPAWCSPSSR